MGHVFSGTDIDIHWKLTRGGRKTLRKGAVVKGVGISILSSTGAGAASGVKLYRVFNARTTFSTTKPSHVN